MVAAHDGVGVAGGAGIASPLNHNTNSAMLPGFSITTSDGSDLALLEPNYAEYGTTSYAVFSNDASALTFTFAAPTAAASLQLLDFANGAVTVYALDASADVVGCYTVNYAPSSGAGQLIGCR